LLLKLHALIVTLVPYHCCPPVTAYGAVWPEKDTRVKDVDTALTPLNAAPFDTNEESLAVSDADQQHGSVTAVPLNPVTVVKVIATDAPHD